MNSSRSGAGAQVSRRRRSDGEQSRTAILEAAARLATVEGIQGLSIARLAGAVGMSKSGLFAHFGSKEELQLATIDAAESLYDAVVIEPAAGATGGLERLRRLVDGYLRYVETDTFPGGCFFASVLAEVDMQPGPVRDRLVAFLAEWLGHLQAAIRDAQVEGDIVPDEDPEQLAFEVEAVILLANAQHVVSRDTVPIARARHAIETLLGRVTAAPRRAPRRTGGTQGRRRTSPN
jgi:AcrR family transcriptional regulator